MTDKYDIGNQTFRTIHTWNVDKEIFALFTSLQLTLAVQMDDWKFSAASFAHLQLTSTKVPLSVNHSFTYLLFIFSE